MSAPDIAVVTPRGRLDAHGAPALGQDLQRHLGLGHKRIVVDLSETTYISSNGLRVLLGAFKTAQRGGGTVVLCGLSTRLKDVFEMVGFDQLFEIYDTCAEAQRAFQ